MLHVHARVASLCSMSVIYVTDINTSVFLLLRMLHVLILTYHRHNMRTERIVHILSMPSRMLSMHAKQSFTAMYWILISVFQSYNIYQNGITL